MQETVAIHDRVCELRKIIAILQWDIPNIKSSSLRAKKEDELMRCKAEFKELLEKECIAA